MPLVELLPQGLPQLACAVFGQSFIGAGPFDFIGGRTRTRTLDPLIKSQLLYAISSTDCKQPPALSAEPRPHHVRCSILERAGIVSLPRAKCLPVSTL
jgi:hypothetical protein